MNQTRVNHLAVIVGNLHDSMKLFASLFDCDPGDIIENDELQIKLCIVRFENISIELIQPTSEKSSFYDELMNRTGVHHLSFEVASLSESIEKAKRNHMALQSEIPLINHEGDQLIFADSKDLHVRLEFKKMVSEAST